MFPAEIDFIIQRPRKKLVLIQIKSTDDIQKLNQQKLSSFKSLTAEISNSETYLISRDKTESKVGYIHYMYWKDLFVKLGI